MTGQDRTIVLAFPPTVSHTGQLLRGIFKYARTYTRWRLIFSAEVAEEAFLGLKDWEGDGVFAMITSTRDLVSARRLRCPIVNLSGALSESEFPRVRPNYRQAGELAAEHLINRQFRRFGFFGIKGMWYAKQHWEGFFGRLQRQGFFASVFEREVGFRDSHSLTDRIVELEAWVSRLKLPVGIYCVRDARSITLVEACYRVGLRVPQDVAVISFDNDETLCEACIPPLTSIERNDAKLGFEAARLLDQLIHGHATSPFEDIVVPVGRVIQRASTDTFGVANPRVATIIEELYRRLGSSVDFGLLAKQVGRSRRWLEAEFRKQLHISPHQFLNRLRLNRAKELMQNQPDLLLKNVAANSGFSSYKQLERIYRRFEKQGLHRHKRRS